jgi:phage tail sheath gpL-like
MVLDSRSTKHKSATGGLERNNHTERLCRAGPNAPSINSSIAAASAAVCFEISTILVTYTKAPIDAISFSELQKYS